jgi:hypothetical protein
MRVIAIMFALLLVMGLSFGGNSFFGSTPSIAADDTAGEAPGGEMTDEATNGSGAETNDTGDKAAPGEVTGDMPDEATNGSGAEMNDTDKSTEGEMPGGDIKDDAAK